MEPNKLDIEHGYCFQCKNEFDLEQNEFGLPVEPEKCPMCGSTDWKIKGGTNILECDISISLCCPEDTAPSALKKEFAEKMQTLVKEYMQLGDMQFKHAISRIPF